MGAGASYSDNNNDQLAAKYGGIYLKAEKDRYHPGEQFNGVIYLNLVAPFPGDSISVIVKGVEKYARVFVVQMNNIAQYHLAKEKSPFMNTRIPVYKNPDGGFQPGQFAFPISFLIPLNIPSSFYQEGEQWMGSVEFKVKAVVEPFDPKNPRLRYKENLLIEENRKLQPVPLEKSENIQLTKCFCYGYGNTTITLGLEKDALTPGETTNLRFKVDNSQGKLSFVSARCELIEHIVLGNNRFHIRHNVIATDLPGFNAKDTLPEQKVQLTIPGYNPANTKFKRIPIKRLQLQDVQQKLYTPGELLPTTLGRIVNIQFFLAVELIYNGCRCCFINPIVYIPVQIYIPDFTLNINIPQAPSGWNPKMMPTTNFTVEMGNLNNQQNEGVGGSQQQGGQQQLIQINDKFMKPQQNSS